MDPLSSVRFVKHGCICFEADDVVVYVDPYLCLLYTSETPVCGP